MGKHALAQYRAQKARNAATPIRTAGKPKASPRPFPPACEAVFMNGRVMTRIVAALIHNIPLGVIARDLRIPRRAVSVIAMRERQL